VTDPVRARRATIDRWNRLATRLGYLCFGVAIAVFVVGVIVGFSDAYAAVVIAAMVIGSILLAPAIVIGYAVKAAEREDRERGL
jgi:ABC-type transport system involved in cytochrome bd biosynthesis fused ATPase/permease subunit